MAMESILLLLLSTIIQYTYANVSGHFTSLTAIGGYEWPNDVISRTHMTSLTLCGLRCSLDNCTSFTYDVTDGLCVTHNALMCTTSGTTRRSMNNYFCPFSQDVCTAVGPAGTNSIQLSSGACVESTTTAYTVTTGGCGGEEEDDEEEDGCDD